MKEKILWAPWRIKYLAGKKEKGCLFCRVKREKKKDKEDYLLFRGKYCLVILNTFPYNNGHLMIAPYRHIKEPSQLKEEEAIEFWRLLNLSVKILKKVLKPEAFNIGINLGRTAGAGFPGHLHLHLVPRWNGDTNFMPVIAKQKVISQSLDKLYQELKKSLRVIRRIVKQIQ